MGPARQPPKELPSQKALAKAAAPFQDKEPWNPKTRLPGPHHGEGERSHPANPARRGPPQRLWGFPMAVLFCMFDCPDLLARHLSCGLSDRADLLGGHVILSDSVDDCRSTLPAGCSCMQAYLCSDVHCGSKHRHRSACLSLGPTARQ